MTESKVVYGRGGTAFVGEDAVAFYQASALYSAIGLAQKGVVPVRGWTMTKALAAASHYTGKKYKRTQAEDARRDMLIWIETMKAALPVEVE
jgi:hypothetical protein